MPDLPPEVWTLICKEILSQSTDLSMKQLCALARVNLALNTAASGILYRKVRTKSIESLLEGYEVDGGNGSGGGGCRYPKAHWLAKIVAIHLDVGSWSPGMTRNIAAALNDTGGSHSDRFAAIFPSMQRLITSRTNLGQPPASDSTWDIMDLPFSSLCVAAGGDRYDIRPPRPLGSNVIAYTRNRWSRDDYNFQYIVADGYSTFRFIFANPKWSMGTQEEPDDSVFDDCAPDIWKVTRRGPIQEWLDSEFSTVDVSKARFEVYGIHNHYIHSLPYTNARAGRLHRERNARAAERYNTRSYEIGGKGEIHLKFFALEDVPPCGICGQEWGSVEDKRVR